MAQLKDIISLEKQRETIDQCRTMHLFLDGTFYRAYEWSAWLCVRYIKDFKPTHRLSKGADESVVFVGFPVQSLEKYTPDGCTPVALGDKCIDIQLPPNLFGNAGCVSELMSEFANWKQCVPLTEASKKRKEEAEHPERQRTRLTDIMHSILAYPIEQKSPLESMMFLAEIKRDLSAII